MTWINERPGILSLTRSNDSGGICMAHRYLSLRSSQTKFLAIVIPLVLLFTVGLFAIVQLNAQRTATRALKAKLQEVTAIQSTSLSAPLWNIDNKQVSHILAAMAVDPDLLGAAVYDESGEIVGQVGQLDAAAQTIYRHSSPIRFVRGEETREIGALVVALTDERVRAATRERRNSRHGGRRPASRHHLAECGHRASPHHWNPSRPSPRRDS